MKAYARLLWGWRPSQSVERYRKGKALKKIVITGITSRTACHFGTFSNIFHLMQRCNVFFLFWCWATVLEEFCILFGPELHKWTSEVELSMPVRHFYVERSFNPFILLQRCKLIQGSESFESWILTHPSHHQWHHLPFLVPKTVSPIQASCITKDATCHPCEAMCLFFNRRYLELMTFAVF